MQRYKQAKQNIKSLFVFMCMCVCLSIYLYHMPGRSESASDPLKLELPMVVTCCHMGAVNQILVLCKNSKCS